MKKTLDIPSYEKDVFGYSNDQPRKINVLNVKDLVTKDKNILRLISAYEETDIYPQAA